MFSPIHAIGLSRESFLMGLAEELEAKGVGALPPNDPLSTLYTNVLCDLAPGALTDFGDVIPHVQKTWAYLAHKFVSRFSTATDVHIYPASRLQVSCHRTDSKVGSRPLNDLHPLIDAIPSRAMVIEVEADFLEFMQHCEAEIVAHPNFAPEKKFLSMLMGAASLVSRSQVAWRDERRDRIVFRLPSPTLCIRNTFALFQSRVFFTNFFIPEDARITCARRGYYPVPVSFHFYQGRLQHYPIDMALAFINEFSPLVGIYMGLWNMTIESSCY